MQVSDDRFPAMSGWNILTLLGNRHHKLAWNLPVPNVQQRTPDDGQRGCPKHVEFIIIIIIIIIIISSSSSSSSSSISISI